MFLYPDNPTRVSIDFLKRMDDDAPGTWLGSVKHNGYRRFATKAGNQWTWRAKPAGSGELKEMPRALREEFEALPWPDGITLDMEWTGTRMIAEHPKHELWVFDVLAGPETEFLHALNSGEPFSARTDYLTNLWYDVVEKDKILTGHIHFVTHFSNPGLVDLFQRQLCDDASEGIVVRRADSKIIGNAHRCVEHPHVRKILKGHLKELPK